jgi:transketolase
VIGLTRFGMSGPGAKVMEAMGITAQAVLDAVKSLD